jgi:hypothetical protein
VTLALHWAVLGSQVTRCDLALEMLRAEGQAALSSMEEVVYAPQQTHPDTGTVFELHPPPLASGQKHQRQKYSVYFFPISH